MNPITDVIQKMVEFFSSRQEEVYVVGGFPRDLVMGCSPKDIDIVVKGEYGDIARAFADRLGSSCVGFHADAKTAKIRISLDSKVIEVDITSMVGASIGEDLHRRDFTMNAMAIPLEQALSESPEIVDPFGAVLDIANGELRITSDVVLRDDPIRCMRGVRLALQKNMLMPEKTSKIIKDHADLLTRVAGERIQSELMLILDSDDATPGVRMMDDLEILETILPEMTKGKGVTQPEDVHAYDVFEHGIATLGFMESFIQCKREDILQVPDGFYEQSVGRYSIAQTLKFVALLHDIGKPDTWGWDDSANRIRFIGHDEVGSELMAGITRRLRFSTEFRQLTTNMVANHMHPHHLAGGHRDPSRRAIRKYYRRTGEASQAILLLGMADYLGGRGHLLIPDMWESYAKGIEKVATGVVEQQQRSVEPLITGRDVLALGIKQGPSIGRILKDVTRAQELGEITSRDEAMEMAEDLVRRQICSQ